MNLSAAPGKAASITGPKAAARLYADIEYELENGDYTLEQAAPGEDALHTLESRFPGIKQQADDVVENGHLPNLSRQAKRGLDRDHEQPKPALHARPRGQHRQEIRHQQATGRRTLRQRASSATAIHARPAHGTRAARVARMRWQQTGAPAAGATATQLVMRTVGAIMGLSFLYLLVSPRGSKAVDLTGSGVNHAVRSLFSPHVDPLRPSTASPRPTAPRRAPRALPGVTHSVPGHRN